MSAATQQQTVASTRIVLRPIGTAGDALCGALALLLEDQGKHVLPLFRRGKAHEAIHGDLHEQIAAIENEPGVRQQL